MSSTVRLVRAEHGMVWGNWDESVIGYSGFLWEK